MVNQVQSLSLSPAEIPEEMVIKAIDSMISRIAPDYLELINQAPQNISNNNKNLLAFTDEERQAFARNTIRSESEYTGKTISIFSEKNGDFGQTLDKARVYVRLIISTVYLYHKNPLNDLLSEIHNKISSLGYVQKDNCQRRWFDVRLERGCLALEGESWEWHFDKGYKTSVTICYSNKKNWSTRIADTKEKDNERPAEHGIFCNALNVFHRAPIPSDLNGEELKADDYRLFIRYNELGPIPNFK